MSIEMKLATSNEAIARNIREGYTRTGGKNWSRIALSTGRDWKDKENAGLVAFFVNTKDLGVKTQAGGLTFIARDQEIEDRAIQNMDKYVAEESGELGTIAFWSKAPHIHNWFDQLSMSATGEHIRHYILLQADVLHKLRDDCALVLETDREQGREAALGLMGELFPLTGEAYEMFSPHSYTQKYFDDLEQTQIFLDHLFTLDGAEDAKYAYDPYF